MVATHADPFLPRVFRVAGVRRELDDAVTLVVRPGDGGLPAFAPGQFNMLYAFGVGEVAISISGADTEQGAFLHTVREVGAVSRALAGLAEGDALGVRGPFGRAWPLEQARGADLVMVAGGLGLAPLRPAIEHVIAQRERYGRVTVLFGTRQPQAVLYPHLLSQWREHDGVDVEVTVDHADASWRGHVGVVPALIPRATFDPPRTVALVCGPEVMMRFTVKALREAGVDPAAIHLSMERNMKCAIGLCGHCQYGPDFVCRDGPVMRYDRIADRFSVREI